MVGAIIIDSDLHRRNSLSRALLDAGIHADPLEDVSELRAEVHNRLIVAEDTEDIEQLFEFCADINWSPPVILFGDEPETVRIVRAMLAGACDYLDLPAEIERLPKRIKAATGRPSPILIARCRAREAQKKVDRLSPREKEVLHSLSEGNSNKQIAAELQISPRTVEIHRSNMLGKLGEVSSYEAVRMFFETQMLSDYFAKADRLSN